MGLPFILGFILFNEPCLLAGFLKLFSKPWRVYELKWRYKTRRGSRRRVLWPDDCRANRCWSAGAPLLWRSWQPIPGWPLKWVHSLLFQRGRTPKLGMSKGIVFALLYNDYSKVWCLLSWEITCRTTLCFENSTTAVALPGHLLGWAELMGSSAHFPAQPSPLVTVSSINKSWQGDPTVRIHNSVLGLLSTAMSDHFPSSLGSSIWRSREPAWEIICLFPVCASWVWCLVRGRHRCLKLNRVTLLRVSWKHNLFSPPAAQRVVASFIKSKILIVVVREQYQKFNPRGQP